MTIDCNQVNCFLELLKVTPTLIVGIIAAIIAWQQSKTAKEQRIIAKAKLNLDLFERRLKVFEATWEAASLAANNGATIIPPPSMTNLYPTASFLFGVEVEAYMKELAGKITEFGTILELTRRNGGHVPPESINEMKELQYWIGMAAVEGVRNIFSPYLSFGQWS
jgi:hypothetical protein